MLTRSTLNAADRKMGRVLVELDIHGGLPETLDIIWHDRRKKQSLDYLGIPYRCNRCHSTRHLRRDCEGFQSPEEPDEELENWDVSDSTLEVELFWNVEPFSEGD
jgi:hypothetical protein